MSAMKKQNLTIEIYDTTLRDGSQAEDVSFSVEDKVRIALKLDELGVHFIEGGWPGANPKDIEFFRIIKTTPLQQAKIVAFGSTRKAKNSAKDDPKELDIFGVGSRPPSFNEMYTQFIQLKRDPDFVLD